MDINSTWRISMVWPFQSRIRSVSSHLLMVGPGKAQAEKTTAENRFFFG